MTDQHPNGPTGDGDGGSRRANKRRRQRGRRTAKGRTDVFWGSTAALPAMPDHVDITPDPAALARSLGPPPLPGHEAIAEHYLQAVYDGAVTVAAALAAAGGLVKPEELEP